MRDGPPSSSEPKLLRLIFEHSSDATVVVDDDGRVLLQNRAARELDGIDVEQLFVWAPERDADMTSFRAQLRVGGRASGEIRMQVGGRVRWIALDGKAHGPHNVVVLRDVTEQHKLKDEVRHLRSVEAVGLLTASVVHDFNNLLTAIVCSSALLSTEVGGQGRPAELAREIRSAGERAAGLVRRVLSILRREPTPPQPVNLSAAVAEIRTLLSLLAGQGIELVTNLHPELADTTVDRERFDQILLNLTANARDAMPRGGTLTISTTNVTLGQDEADAAECPGQGAYVALTVSDTGEGMDGEVRERVFERFFTTKDVAQGTGLGLATAHRFVTESGGCITVRSARGQGTTVVVYLPQTPAARVVPPVASEPEPPRGGVETIVVVEPDDQVRGAVRSVLKQQGYRVIDAPTGGLALRQAELSTAPVRLVVADAAPHGTGGHEVVERLRRSGHPAMLLFVSGDTDRAIAGLGLQGEPLLRKVFTPEDLARRVRETLDAHGTARVSGRKS
jgi:two-component system cell cycle sensor histidine kinase/response regulator CckA